MRLRNCEIINVFHEHKVLNNAYRVFATFLLEKLNSDGNKIRFCWTQKEQRHWRYNLQKEEENDSVTLQMIHDLIRVRVFLIPSGKTQ